MASKKGEKQIFKDLVFALAANLPHEEAEFSKWITLYGGKIVQEVDESVTHFLCTVAEFETKRKKKGSNVHQALQQKKTCKIVKPEWLDACLMPSKKAKVQVDDYLVQTEVKEKASNARKERKKNLPVNEQLFHIYYDEEAFPYQVTITRDDNNPGERYLLTLYESNARPHLYTFVAKLTQNKGARPKFWPPKTTQLPFLLQLREFKRFFKKKTSLDWDARVVKAGTTDPELFFQYQYPTGGKPVGVIGGRYARATRIFLAGVRSRTTIEAPASEGMEMGTDNPEPNTDDAGNPQTADPNQPVAVEEAPAGSTDPIDHFINKYMADSILTGPNVGDVLDGVPHTATPEVENTSDLPEATAQEDLNVDMAENAE